MNYKNGLFLTIGLITLTIGVIILLLRNKFIFEYKSPFKINIVQTWFLPDELKEISGIYHLGDQEIACIQDEDGIIYIYNLASEKVTDKIKFGEKGDYEGIAINKEIAYILKSNGEITVIENFRNENFKIKSHQIFNDKKLDFEGLFLVNDRQLLMGVKEHKKEENPESILVYSLDINTMELDKEPLINISMDDKVFAEIPNSHPSRYFYLSEIAQHPITEEYYILEGRTPKLLILNPDKSTKTLIYLDSTLFPQPEGLTFDGEGRVFISNEEDKNEPQNIQLIEIKENKQKK
ncbi:MAG: hypothetical protein ACTIKA_04545 [Psychroflexus halocasei]